jgi:hypothetical protein
VLTVLLQKIQYGCRYTVSTIFGDVTGINKYFKKIKKVFHIYRKEFKRLQSIGLESETGQKVHNGRHKRSYRHREF